MNFKKVLTYQRITIVMTAVFVFVAMPLCVSAAYKVESLGSTNALYKDFVVGPGKVEVELTPGQSKVVPITVTNRMGETRVFRIEVEDFKGSTDLSETVIMLGNERGPYSLKDFLKFEAPTVELKDGERATIPVTVSLPTDVEPGGRYGSVLVSTVAKEATVGQSSAIVSRLGVLFFVKTPGEVNEVGKLAGFNTADGQKIFGGSPITFRLLYQNDGSVHVNPYGEIRVKNIIGEEVGIIEIDPWFAMPQSMRLREISWNRSMMFGRYTAVASINRGYDNIIDTETLTFWVIPWKITLGVFVAILVLVFALRFVLTRFEFKRKA